MCASSGAQWEKIGVEFDANYLSKSFALPLSSDIISSSEITAGKHDSSIDEKQTSLQGKAGKKFRRLFQLTEP